MLEQMTLLVIQLGLIIFAAFLGGSLFKILRMPGVLGELLAGTLIGPHLLGGIPLPGFENGLFPMESPFPVSPELYGFTTIASIILLFLVGLETDLKMFLRYSVAGSLVGIGGAVFSFLLGCLITVIFSRQVLGVDYSFSHPIPMFLGIICSATSVGITARILSERKKVDSPEGVTILSAAVIDDVLGIIFLAIVLGIAKSGHVEWGQVRIIALNSIGVWLGFTALGLILSKPLGRLLKGLKEPATIAILSFGMALLLAGIFEQAGLAMIIGAYVVGLAFSQTDLTFLIQEQLSGLYKLFVPVFFCVMGMLVDFKVMTTPNVLTFGLVYTFIAVLSKMVGCGLPTLFLNFNLLGATRIGLGMIPRGEVALIISGIGLTAGILPPDFFGVAMMMTFLTTLITPYILILALHSDKPGIQKREGIEQERKQLVFPLPSSETTELVLSKIVSALREEGFFVHLIDLDERVYQIRKEDIAIGMTAASTRLTFTCEAAEATLIHTLLNEALVDLERTMRDLQRSEERDQIRRKIIQESENKDAEGSKLLSLINPFAVTVSLQGKVKREILEELLDLMVNAKELSRENRELALKDVLGRESIMSSGMQDGIALPHAKTDAVDHLICAIGVHPEGIEFNSLDGKPARIFVLVLSPKNTPGFYLQFMAAVSRLLSNKETRASILSAGSRQELYQIITK